MKTMAEDQRNFRSYYYAKVGFPSVDEKKSLEKMFKENKLDDVKFAEFSIRFPIPTMYRLIIWKILLHVLPLYQCNHDFVWKVKCEMYDDFYLTVLLMQLAELSTAVPIKFLKMYLMSERKLVFDHKGQEEEAKWQNFMVIAKAFEDLCSTEEEAFWLTKHFYNCIQKNADLIPIWIENVETLLLKEDVELYRHLQSTGALKALPLERWLQQCFAGLISITSLVRIWDRMIGSYIMPHRTDLSILPCVAVAILLALRRHLHGAKTSWDALQVINSMLEENAEVIVSKAIEIWQKSRPYAAM